MARTYYSLDKLADNIKAALREQYEWLKQGGHAPTWHTLIPSILLKMTRDFEEWYNALLKVYSKAGLAQKVSKQMLAVTPEKFEEGMCTCRYHRVVYPIPGKVLVSQSIDPIPPLCPLAVLAFGSIGKGFNGTLYISPEPIDNEACETLYPNKDTEATAYLVHCKRDPGTNAIPVLWNLKRREDDEKKKRNRHGAREHFIY